VRGDVVKVSVGRPHTSLRTCKEGVRISSRTRRTTSAVSLSGELRHWRGLRREAPRKQAAVPIAGEDVVANRATIRWRVLPPGLRLRRTTAVKPGGDAEDPRRGIMRETPRPGREWKRPKLAPVFRPYVAAKWRADRSSLNLGFGRSSPLRRVLRALALQQASYVIVYTRSASRRCFRYASSSRSGYAC
jgi:hypothetical protein